MANTSVRKEKFVKLYLIEEGDEWMIFWRYFTWLWLYKDYVLFLNMLKII